MAQAWAPVHVGDGLVLIYGPRVGRAYLLPLAEAEDAAFTRLVGLRHAARYEALLDPALHVETTLLSARARPAPDAPLYYAVAYRLLDWSRRFLPLGAAARALRRLAARRALSAPPEDAPAAIGAAVHAVERRLGCGDCYPRALLTAYLSLKYGRSCTLAAGVLSPTRKMHVWCVVEHAIPYEPSPEHYLYQPLWTLTLSP